MIILIVISKRLEKCTIETIWGGIDQYIYEIAVLNRLSAGHSLKNGPNNLIM